MRDDPVERLLRRKLIQVALKQFDVRQSKIVDQPAPRRNLTLGKVKPLEASSRKRDGHRDEIGAIGAAHLEDTTLLHRRSIQAEQLRHHGKVVRMGVRIGR